MLRLSGGQKTGGRSNYHDPSAVKAAAQIDKMGTAGGERGRGRRKRKEDRWGATAVTRPKQRQGVTPKGSWEERVA